MTVTKITKIFDKMLIGVNISTQGAIKCLSENCFFQIGI